MTQPRIAHVISTRGMGGAERFLAQLVAHGEAGGWAQVVLNPFATAGSAPLAALCQPVRCETRPCASLRDLPPTRHWLQDRLDDFAPDVVHVMLFHALVVVATLRKSKVACRVVTNVYGEGIDMAVHGKVLRLADRWAGRRVDHVTAISQAVRQFLVTDYGYPSAHVTCIPLGWEGDPLPRRTAPRRPTIICVGGLRPEKGHAVLLAAVAEVRRDISDVRLVVIGDGDLRPKLEAQVSVLKMNDAVEFLGAVPDIWPHLADADVFAIASRSEAFGIAIAEAMAAGLPVVAPAVGGIPELVLPGKTGELYPPGDHKALASAIVHLLKSPDLRSKMGDDAQQAAEPLRMDTAVGRYFELFEKVCPMAGK